MATDARIAVGLPAHPKTKKLVKRLGQASAWNLVCLILWAASNRSDGDLSGMSTEDIELASDWEGDEGALVAALVAVRFIDGAEGAYVLHDWEEHNPWAAGAEKRSAKARWNAAKRHHGVEEADRLVPEYAAVRSATSNASSKDSAEEQETRGNAPSPSPSPSPSPNPNSVPIGTDAANAPSGMTDPERRKADAWQGIKSLLNAHGMPKAQTGAFVGKLAKDFGEDIALTAMEAAIVKRPGEPDAWLTATCQSLAGQRAPPEPAWRAEQRARTAQAAPGVAAQQVSADKFFIDVEARNVAPRLVG